jgi:hypothetical protein
MTIKSDQVPSGRCEKCGRYEKASIEQCFIGDKDCPRVPTLAPTRETAPAWRPMETAPKDGTLLRLQVSFTEHSFEDSNEPTATIGSNSLKDTGIDEWLFAGWSWEQDRFTQGEGEPIGWLPMLADREQRPAALSEADDTSREMQRAIHEEVKGMAKAFKERE